MVQVSHPDHSYKSDRKFRKILIVFFSIACIFVVRFFSALIFPLSGTEECEGYWADTEICLSLGKERPYWFHRTRKNSKCPQWRIDYRWNGKQQFSTKLQEIENVAKEWRDALSKASNVQMKACNEIKPLISMKSERGIAWSRIEEGIMAGNSEYREIEGNMCWTDALQPLYVEKFNILPSKEFQEKITTFNLEKFQDEFENLKHCLSK